MTDAVRDNAALERYELGTGSDVAFLQYRRRDGVLILAHTEVPEALRGQHLASRLAEYALDTARVDGRQVVVRCPFVAAYVRRHPAYDDIIAATLPGPAEPPAS
jgi:predicted GNAT family acetyltransferase